MLGACGHSLADLLEFFLVGVRVSEDLQVFFNIQVIMGSLGEQSDWFWRIRIYCETTKLKLSLRKIQLKRNATNSNRFLRKVDAMLKRQKMIRFRFRGPRGSKEPLLKTCRQRGNGRIRKCGTRSGRANSRGQADARDLGSAVCHLPPEYAIRLLVGSRQIDPCPVREPFLNLQASRIKICISSEQTKTGIIRQR